MAVRKIAHADGYYVVCGTCDHFTRQVITQKEYLDRFDHYEDYLCPKCLERQSRPPAPRIPVQGPGIGLAGIREYLMKKSSNLSPD